VLIEKGGALQCKKYLNEEILEIFANMKPHGQARGPQKTYPPTPKLRWVIRRRAKSAEA